MYNYLTLDSVYPYTGTEDTCAYTRDASTYIKHSQYWYIYQNDVTETKEQVAISPITTGIHSC